MKTDTFKRIASPIFGVTLSCMYPFIVTDKTEHKALLKKTQYPIKQLWPKSVLKRYKNFTYAFNLQREEIFESYEKAGGTYHPSTEDSRSETEPCEEKQYEHVDLDCDKDF